MGLNTTNAYKVVASCKNQEIKDLLKTHDLNSTTLNARQCFEGLKASKGEAHSPLPYKCHRKPPKDINVYTDGSWVFPRKQFLGIGGAGVWWPGRDPRVSHLLSKGEKELAYFKQLEDGLMLYTPIGGYTGSSTRTELAAAIIAILANGPTHIGTDRQAFCDKANNILWHLRARKKLKINWKLSSDGDLWDHFQRAAIAKGPHSIRITKVKGHITQSQVDEGVYRSCDKQGNDAADHAADVAVETHGKDLMSVAKIFHKRHQQYSQLMVKVAKHIIEAFLIHKKLNDRLRHKSQRAPGLIYYQPLLYQPPISTTTLNIQSSIKHFKAFSDKKASADAREF